MSNFKFLKPIERNLYEIIVDAEKLYQGEFFEQCIGQTRRFGEHVCKNVLGSSLTTEKTFDDMLATLKDKVSLSSVQEKEFVDDLYFLKKEGNASVHSAKVKQDGLVALECLQRAFEIAINYAVYYKKTSVDLLRLQYDTELLITGKKKKKTLSERYLEEKSKNKSEKKKIQKRRNSDSVVLNKKTSRSLFWLLIGVSTIVSITLLVTFFILTKI